MKICRLLLLLPCYLFSLQPNLDLSVVGGDVLEQFLLENVKGRKVCYCPNPGNAGDALIWWGTVCLFKKLGIKFTLYHPRLSLSGIETIVYPGGGNLVPFYNDCAFFLGKHMNLKRPIVVLPHTIQGHELLLTRLLPNVTLFCREKMSYEYCKEVVPFANNVFLACDLAFYADLTPFVKKARGKNRSKTLFAFRTDCEINEERRGVVLPASNKDIPVLCGDITQMSSYNQNYAVVKCFVKAIDSYDEVWTDRLHVGIAAFLLGKRVHLFDNSYGKNRAVYESSIKKLDSHQLVHFHEDWEELSFKLGVTL